MPGQSRYHHFYNTQRWRRIAWHQLMAEPLCRFCAERGLAVPATVADHVEPHDGDLTCFWLGRLQSLCSTCHNKDKQLEERRGYRTDVGKDGWPIDPRHPANAPRR
jgi:5-methylcytosine-specific restriction enzyme A